MNRAYFEIPRAAASLIDENQPPVLIVINRECPLQWRQTAWHIRRFPRQAERRGFWLKWPVDLIPDTVEGDRHTKRRVHYPRKFPPDDEIELPADYWWWAYTMDRQRILEQYRKNHRGKWWKEWKRWLEWKLGEAWKRRFTAPREMDQLMDRTMTELAARPENPANKKKRAKKKKAA